MCIRDRSKTNDAGVIEPVNPTTGDVLGRVHASSKADYDTIVERAQACLLYTSRCV